MIMLTFVTVFTYTSLIMHNGQVDLFGVVTGECRMFGLQRIRS